MPAIASACKASIAPAFAIVTRSLHCINQCMFMMHYDHCKTRCLCRLCQHAIVPQMLLLLRKSSCLWAVLKQKQCTISHYLFLIRIACKRDKATHQAHSKNVHTALELLSAGRNEHNCIILWRAQHTCQPHASVPISESRRLICKLP